MASSIMIKCLKYSNNLYAIFIKKKTYGVPETKFFPRHLLTTKTEFLRT